MPQPTLSDVHIERAIRNVAIRYENKSYITANVAPVVNVRKESDKYFVYSKGDWFRDDADDNRRPNTRAPRTGYGLEQRNYELFERAQAYELADRIRDNADDPLRPYEDASRFCMNGVMLRRERAAAQTLFSSSAWNSNSRITLTGNSRWSDYSNSNPATDLVTAINTILQQTGMRPNVLILGQEVYSILRQHPDGLDRYKHTRQGIMTREMIATWLDVDRIEVGTAVHNTAKEGQDESMNFIWGKNALLMFVTGSPSIREPSAAYTFQKEEPRTKRWREEAEDQDVIECTHLHRTYVVAQDCGYFIENAVA